MPSENMRKRPVKIGIFDPYLFELGGGERYVSIFAETLQNGYDVEILSYDHTSLRQLESRFQLDLGGVKKRQLPHTSASSKKTRRNNWLKNFFNDTSHDREKAAFTADYDIFINLSNGIPIYSHARESIFLLQMPYFEGWADENREAATWKDRLKQGIFGTSLTIEEMLKLRAYRTKLSNSRFTRDWIRRIWNVDSEVVYAGLDTSLFVPSEKENIILSVGRFQPDLFCKNQHILVEEFKSMCAGGLNGWVLHLVGGVSEKPNEKEYVAGLIAASRGHPIEIHPNAEFRELLELYGKSRIYWHATGLTEEEDKTPWRMEHFGLTTVEAMSAGCVPIVIGKGGQKEIVEHGVSGLLWNTVDELKAETWKIIQARGIEQQIRSAAMQRSRYFEKPVFQRKIRKIVGDLMAPIDGAVLS